MLYCDKPINFHLPELAEKCYDFFGGEAYEEASQTRRNQNLLQTGEEAK
jgi:hypothetical protein